MSKKEAVFFLIIMTISFMLALSILVSGLIIINPHIERDFFIGKILIIVGAIYLFLTVLILAFTTISSNYLKSTKKEQSTNN